MSEPRRMLGQVLGRHHRLLQVAGTNCTACHQYHPTSTDLINAIEGAGRAVQDDGLDVERLWQAMFRTVGAPSMKRVASIAAEYDRLRAASPLNDPREEMEISEEREHGG